MMRFLIKGAFIYGLMGGLKTLIEFVLLPIYSRVLLPGDFGKLDLLLIFMTVGSVAAILELYSSVFRFYFEEDSVSYRKNVVSTAMYAILITSGIILLLVFSFSTELSTFLLGDSSHAVLFKLGALFILLDATITVPLTLLRIEDKPLKYAVVSLIQIGCYLVGIGVFVVGLKLSVEGIMFAKVISIVPALILCLRYSNLKLALKIDWRILKNMLRYSLPLIPVGISLWGINSLNRLFMVRYLSLDQIGLFSMGSKFVALMTISIIGFQLAWPQFAFSKMRENNSSGIFSRAFGYFVAFELWLVLFLTLFAGQLLKLVSTSQYFGAINIIFPLSLGMFLYGVFYFFTTNSIIAKSTLKIIPSIVVALIVNILMNMIITPKYGILGTAWVTVITYLAMAATMALFSKAYEHLLLEWPKIVRLIAVAVVFIAVALNLLDKTGPTWIGIKAVVFLVFPAALMLIRFIDLGNISADFSAHQPTAENNNIPETAPCVELPVD